MTQPRNPSHRRRRTVAPTVLAAAAAVALAACGGASSGGQRVSLATPTTVAQAIPAVAVCAPVDLRADQLPVSSGTGRFFLAWSLTDIGPTSCQVPAGQPTLAFLNASGSAISDYAVTHLPTATDAAVTIGSGQAAWFLTEESTTTCGTGTVVDGGPFHYVIGLPVGTGSVAWTAAYLSSPTLSDFCGSVSLAVGDVQATKPTTP